MLWKCFDDYKNVLCMPLLDEFLRCNPEACFFQKEQLLELEIVVKLIDAANENLHVHKHHVSI